MNRWKLQSMETLCDGNYRHWKDEMYVDVSILNSNGHDSVM